VAVADKHQLKVLLTRALSGDPSAWNDFFREIAKYVHAEVRKVLGSDVRVCGERSAVVQETLVRVWERIGDQFTNGPDDVAIRRFLAWISTIARNRSLDELRKETRNRAVPAGSDIERVAEVDPLKRRQKRDQLSAEVGAAVARLPERQRQVVELFWFEGLADTEISKRLGCSAGAVRVLRLRALRKLQSPRLQSLLE
jgi:RNA polymerase sigma-70 factor (ECF subfamily)